MKYTVWILIVAAAILISWDVVALMKYGEPGTISAVLLNLSKTDPVIPFAFGIVAGHLFWPQRGA